MSTRTFLVVSVGKIRQGRASGIRIAHLNNFRALWGTRPPLGAGVLQAGDSGLECKILIQEVVQSRHCGWIGLHKKGILPYKSFTIFSN